MVLQLWTCRSLFVCSLRLPEFVYPSKPFLIRVGGFPVWDQGLTPGWEGPTKLNFLSDISFAEGASLGAFSPQLINLLLEHPLHSLASLIHIS